MNSHEIALLVAERATRFGDRDPQQLSQLLSRLEKVESRVVAAGLLEVFAEGSPPPGGSRAQELAGALLARLAPSSSIELEPFLRVALPRYELSVEQLPLYLAQICGAREVEAALAKVECGQFGTAHKRAIETFRFWLRTGWDQHGAPHAT